MLLGLVSTFIPHMPTLNPSWESQRLRLGGYQQLVRAELFTEVRHSFSARVLVQAGDG